MPKFIKWAKERKASQPIYHLAPDTHKLKVGTPTMGGIIFVFATLIATILTAKLNNYYVMGGIIAISLFSAIGIKDDLSKISNNQNDAGLSVKMKFILQIISAILIIVMLFYVNHSTELYIPFYKYPLFDMSFFSLILWVLVIIATSNAVNLTDGLDGLASVPSLAALTSFSIIIYITGHAKISAYLLMPNIQVGEVAIISAALMGALSGFLWFNCHPAEIFMGDSGSLTIGAFLAYLAIISKSEILLLLIGFIFVVETVSVILQVGSYKLRGKRVFLMAPIHHHFEKKGWHENKVIIRFWIIAFMSNLVAIMSLKIR